MNAADTRFKLGALLLAAVLAACSAPLSPPRPAGNPGAAASTEAPFEIETFRWRGQIDGAPRVVAENAWGDLRTRTADRGGLLVSAMIQRIGNPDDEFEIRVDRKPEAVEVKVLPRVARPRGRVDLTLIIPAGKRLHATTRHGLAELKYKGDIVARTRSGDIHVKTPGHARVRSQTGNITARLSGKAWEQPMSFASAGDITVVVPEDSDIAVRAETAGAIDIGIADRDGGSELRIASVAGDVRVIPLIQQRTADAGSGGLTATR